MLYLGQKTTDNDRIAVKSELGGGGGSSFTWNTTSGTSATLSASNGYIAGNASLVTYTLPASAAVGDYFRIVGNGAGGWKLAQNASQLICFGTAITTSGTGGYLASSNRYDVIELLCVTANTKFMVISSIGNITYV